MAPTYRDGSKKRAEVTSDGESSNAFDSGEEGDVTIRPQAKRQKEAQTDGGKAGESGKSIPLALVRRILNEFFEKDGTGISKNANAAVGKYVDVFLQEAIARTAVEKRSGFLEAS